MKGKLLEFFIHILKVEVDGSNWVMLKDCFAFATVATKLEKCIDSTGALPHPPAFILGGPKISKWLMDEDVIKQAISTMISNSLFIELQMEVMAV